MVFWLIYKNGRKTILDLEPKSLLKQFYKNLFIDIAKCGRCHSIALLTRAAFYEDTIIGIRFTAIAQALHEGRLFGELCGLSQAH